VDGRWGDKELLPGKVQRSIVLDRMRKKEFVLSKKKIYMKVLELEHLHRCSLYYSG
jgi:hypothetical protein